ncbi:MAG: magnesium transporter [Chloroflexi bacterium]|jgi:magnesium transporter|nr:MAG: magnesium transporter [Chloroflexota bacterium]
MLNSIIGNLARPLGTTEDIDQKVYSLSSHMESKHRGTALFSFLSLPSADQADVILRLPREHQLNLISWVKPANFALIAEELETGEFIHLMTNIPLSDISRILEFTSPSIAADILKNFSQADSYFLTQHMRHADEILALMSYDSKNAGGLMTTSFFSVNQSMTVGSAAEYIRSFSYTDLDDVSSVLVVDDKEFLVGIFNITRLVTAPLGDPVSSIIFPSIISVAVDTDREECARIMERYNLLTLPVTDEYGHLVGTLKIEDMIFVLQEEATEDMYRMVGVDEEVKLLGPIWVSIKGRFPWLFINLITVGLAAVVITLFQSTLSQVLVLAVFIPVIAGQGGIAGTQTLTLVVRSMALGEIRKSDSARLLSKEIGIGLIHGVMLGLVAGIVAYYWHGSEYIGAVVGVAMLGNLIVASISGVSLPLILKTLNIDPALASAVAVTTLTDVIGLVLYLGLATILLPVIT